MVFGLFKNYPIFRYIIYDFLKKVSRGSRPTCLAKIFCALGRPVDRAMQFPNSNPRAWHQLLYPCCQDTKKTQVS